MSDVMTSPEGSPRMVDRYRPHHYYDDEPYGEVVGGGYVVRTEQRSDRATQDGREQVFSRSQTEVQRWSSHQ